DIANAGQRERANGWKVGPRRRRGLRNEKMSRRLYPSRLKWSIYIVTPNRRWGATAGLPSSALWGATAGLSSSVLSGATAGLPSSVLRLTPPSTLNLSVDGASRCLLSLARRSPLPSSVAAHGERTKRRFAPPKG